MTVKEIAALAGVSRGTVDRVLHNRPGVSKENYERITKIIEEHNFRPNTLARALSRKQVKKKIGMILNSVGNPFFEDIQRGLDGCTADYASYDLSFEVCRLKGYDPNEQAQAIDRLAAKGIDGLIITAVNHSLVAEKLKKLKSRGMPVITVNTDLEEESARTDYIGCDYLQSGRLAGGVLDLLSFGRPVGVGIVQGSRDIRGHILRRDGFCQVAERLPGVSLTWEVACEDDEQVAYENTLDRLKTAPVDLIYVVASGTAGVMRAIEEASPKTVAITNDLLPINEEYLQKDVIKATIYQQPYEQGYNALRRMIDCLYGQDDMDPSHYKIRMRIITKYH